MLPVALRPGTTVPVAGSQGQLHRGQTITNMAAYRRPWGEGESPAGHVIGQRALILLQLERRGSGGWTGNAFIFRSITDWTAGPLPT